MDLMVIRAHERGHAFFGWLDSYHTFSFGNYMNPDRMNFGALRVLNDVKGIGVVRLSGSDVIRHKLVKAIIAAYEKSEEQKEKLPHDANSRENND